ncbi:MAG: NifX-associated nitrogen fixation protein [Gammaproteobacteria bacterium]
MNQAALVVEENDPALGTPLMNEMVKQMRALDAYGTYDNWPIAKIVDPFVMTKERKREIPVVGDPDEIVMSRVSAYYNALATMIEAECGLMAVPMIKLTHEGFGRVLITVGKLVVLDRTLRDVHRFGFKSLEAMSEEAGKLVTKAVALVEKYREVAKD